MCEEAALPAGDAWTDASTVTDVSISSRCFVGSQWSQGIFSGFSQWARALRAQQAMFRRYPGSAPQPQVGHFPSSVLMGSESGASLVRAVRRTAIENNGVCWLSTRPARAWLDLSLGVESVVGVAFPVCFPLPEGPLVERGDVHMVPKTPQGECADDSPAGDR